MKTAYPIALQIASDDVDQTEREQIARLIYSYIVRRAVCGLTAKNLNQVFQSIAQQFVNKGPSVKTLAEIFHARTGDSARFPDNREFQEGVFNGDVCNLARDARTKDILWELELASRSHLAEQIKMSDELWTEHVLPVSWTTDEWPFADGKVIGRDSGDPKAEERNHLLGTLGNLTLISDKLNSSVGNRGFLHKKDEFKKHAGLFLNKWFTDRSSWTEDDIRERGAKFAEMAVQIWQGFESADSCGYLRT